MFSLFHAQNIYENTVVRRHTDHSNSGKFAHEIPELTQRRSLAKRPHVTKPSSELEVDSQNVLADIDAACTDIRDFIKSGSRRTRLLSREEHEAARQDDGVLGHHGPLTASIETVLDSPDVLDCPVSVDRLSRQHSS